MGSRLRGPLRAWAESLIKTRQALTMKDFLTRLLSERWAAHLSGQRDWQYSLWTVLMFQAWRDQHAA